MCNGDVEWQFKGCPSLKQRKQYFINKAISTGDLLCVDETVVHPISLDGNILSYRDMSDLLEYVVDINKVNEVTEHE